MKKDIDSENIPKTEFSINCKEPILKKRAINLEKIDIKNINAQEDSNLNSVSSISGVNFLDKTNSKILSTDRAYSIGLVSNRSNQRGYVEKFEIRIENKKIINTKLITSNENKTHTVTHNHKRNFSANQELIGHHVSWEPTINEQKKKFLKRISNILHHNSVSPFRKNNDLRGNFVKNHNVRI